jgi:hypothetical protein
MGAQDSYVYVIRVDFKDGTAEHPVFISRSEPDWESQLDDAVEFFTKLHRDSGIVSVDYAKDIYLAGVNTPETIVDWSTYRRRIVGL